MSVFAKKITLGQMMGLMGYNDNHMKETFKTAFDTVELNFALEKESDDVYKLCDIPLKYHHYCVGAIEKSDKAQVRIVLNAWVEPYDIRPTLKEIRQRIMIDIPVILKFKSYKITDDTFNYKDIRNVPIKFDDVPVINQKYSYKKESFIISLDCAPPSSYNFYEPH